MRRLIDILVLASLLGLSACTQPTPASTATLPPSPTPLPSPTDTPAPTATALPTATATSTPRPTHTVLPPSPTLEASATTTANQDQLIPTGQPLKSWNGIPVMPGATSGAAENVAYRYVAKGDRNAVRAYYDLAMPKLGYLLVSAREDFEGNILSFYLKGDKLSFILVSTIKGFTVVMFSASD